MDRLSLFDMLAKFFNYLGRNPLFILIFVVLVLVYFYLILSPIYTKKHKIIYTIFFSIATIALIVIYGSTFWSFIDYMIDNIFIAIYFPNLPIYVLMLLTTIVIFVVTMFKKNISKNIKRLNTFLFLLIIFLLLLSLNIVMTKNINIYSEIAIYSNEYLLVMIQMTMNIFSIWIIVLLIIKLINKLGNKASEKEKTDQQEIETKENIEGKKIIPEEKQQFIAREEEPFTVEEYKLLYEYLKEIKEKRQNDDNLKK